MMTGLPTQGNRAPIKHLREGISAEAPIATDVVPEVPAVEAIGGAPAPAKLSKKDKKKAKKNQGADLDWAEATDDSIVKAEEPVVEDSITAAALPEVSVAEPIEELPEPAKLSKKDKKKAKKNQSWESDWTADTPQESTATATDVEAPVVQIEGETPDLGLETPLDSTTAFDEPDAGSKKGKKKKKGKKATSLDEEATPVVLTEPVPEAILADEPAIQDDNVSTGSITPTGLSASYKQDEAMLAWEDALDDHSAIKSPPQAAQGLGNELRQADDPAPDDASDIFFDAEDEARALSRAATPANADFNAQAMLNETTPEAKPPAPDPWADETFFLPPKKSKIKGKKKTSLREAAPPAEAEPSASTEAPPVEDPPLAAFGSQPLPESQADADALQQNPPFTDEPQLGDVPVATDETTNEGDWGSTATTKQSKKQKKKGKKGSVSELGQGNNQDDASRDLASSITMGGDDSPLPTRPRRTRKRRASDQDGQDQDMLSSSGGGGDDNVSSGPGVGGISGIAEATLPETSTEWSAGVGADSGSADNGGEHERQQRDVLPLHAITDATGAADAATTTAPEAAAADEATSGGEAGAAGKELSSTDQAAATDRAAGLAGDLAPSRPFADDNCLLHADDAPLSGEASGPTSNDDKSTGDTRGTDAQTVDPALTDSTLEVGAPQELPGPVLALDNTTPDEPQVVSSHVAPEAEVTFVTENSATLPEGDDMAVPTIVKPDDEWAETPSSKKKGKKGKKKAAAASSAWGDESESAQQQPEEVKSIDDFSVSTPSQDEPVSLPQPAEPEGPALDDPVTAPTPAADDDEWALPASGKKSKKNKKKKGSAITSDEPVLEPETPTQTTEESLALDQPSPQVEPQPPTAPELAEPLENVEPALAAEAAEDEWAASTSGKKAKKSKKKKTLAVEEPESEAAVAPELAPQPEAERSVDDMQTLAPQLETSPDLVERAPVPDAADDEWASQPAGKKGKKNKKKRESASASDEPTAEPAASEVVNDILASDSAAPEKTVDEPTVEGPSPATEDIPVLTAPASSELVEAAEDEWASQPAGKKSKKDRREEAVCPFSPDGSDVRGCRRRGSRPLPADPSR
ncbi:predicted protein [Verticillium alfalfae VaMs.102]|uniref:Predicted protein n=1 Tax=Verticillium alfalfae (strain VaMs.102 / ATCC MYA-4576 / FGSC 10136) TaxID=526221 RepID=C9SHG9_VERA1|nr:predicted protein [Verticillium alfalfae VaMs.102]EEY18392.1 predicted protein [Verticillium alfalfae VaMs.102]